MFGYVRPPLGALPRQEAERFARMYCGLCHALSRRYGQRARMILNFDFTYLAILLSAGQEGAQAAGRCCASPIRKRPFSQTTPALALAADESVILTHWQLRDAVEDRGFLPGLKYRLSAAALTGPYRRAAQRRRAFDEAVRRQIGALHRIEQEREPSMDRAADTFARLLQGAAETAEAEPQRRVLRELLYHLGRWIYLIDAADDLKEDAAAGRYNPVAQRYSLTDGAWTPESRRSFALTLDHSVHRMAAAFELGEFGAWTPLLRETFYSGLRHTGAAVLSGTFRKGRRPGQGTKRRADERSVSGAGDPQGR